MMGYTFNRQKPLDRFIVDFYCKPLKLVIEIDGSTHDDEVGAFKDEKRQKILEDLGLSFNILFLFVWITFIFCTTY